MSELAAALEDVMVPGVLDVSRFRLLLAYWEKRGELGPYPRDDHGHRRFGSADLVAIRARVTRWHTEDAARAAKYRAKPVHERERGWTKKAERRHGVRRHAGPFEVCEHRLCHPYTPKAVAYRAFLEARVMAQMAAEPS